MSNEIKVGDKVRVRKDAPKIYTEGWSCDWLHAHSNVRKTEGDSAEIELDCYALVIPLKYLIKVDEEKKEAKFKVGNIAYYVCSPTLKHKCTVTKVMQNEHSGKWEYNVMFEWGKPGMYLHESELEPYTEPKAPKIKVGDRVRCKNPIRLASSTDNDFIGIVTDAVTDGENGWFNVRMNKGATFQTYYESDLELIEPAEQTHQRATIISEGDIHSLDETPTNNVGSIKIPVEVDLTDGFWDAYTAGLAKEVAMKVSNKYNAPEQAAEYAVSVAKAVVEWLKRK